MAGLNARRAAAVLADDVQVFERLGYQPLEHRSFAATLEAPRGGRRIVLRLHREGRIFGGNWALEITTAEPVLPASGTSGQQPLPLIGVGFLLFAAGGIWMKGLRAARRD